MLHLCTELTDLLVEETSFTLGERLLQDLFTELTDFLVKETSFTLGEGLDNYNK